MKTRPLPTALPPVFALSQASTASALPGERRAAAAAGLGLDEASWRTLLAMRAGGSLAVQAWGEAEQQAVADLTSQRLAQLQGSGERLAQRHLARLQGLLGEQLAALSATGWRAGERAAACWQRSAPEIDELAGLLAGALPPLAQAQQNLLAQAAAARQAAADLAERIAQGESLASLLNEDMQQVLLSRQPALLASQVLSLELAALTALDAQRLASLAEAIRLGVLLRLPSVLALLGQICGRPSETRLFQLRENLNELIDTLRRTTP